MNIGANLTLDECLKSSTAIRLGIGNTPTGKEVYAMINLCQYIYDPLCSHFKRKIPVTSFYRSVELNKAIGGSGTSQHCKGEAVDLDCDSFNSIITNDILFHYIKQNMVFDQLIWEFGSYSKPDWVHVSRAVTGRQRMQVLRAIKINNVTKYEPFE